MLCNLADEHPDRLQVWCVRPSVIVEPDSGATRRIAGKLFQGIGMDHVTGAMITIALDGYETRLVENDALQKF